MTGTIEITTFDAPSIVFTRLGDELAVEILRDTAVPRIEITGVVSGPKGEEADEISEQEIVDIIEENGPLAGLSNLSLLFKAGLIRGT